MIRAILFVVGLGFGVAPFIGGLRRLPRWIRFALVMSGVSLFLGAAVGTTLNQLRPRLSRAEQVFVYSHELVLYGIGLGVILLLILSGEIFRALRALDAERRERLSGA
jgi:hypothetical protein